MSDSRSEFESTFTSQRQVRRTSFGVQQQYQPQAGNAHYSVRVERSIEYGAADGVQHISDRLNMTGSYSLPDHDLEGEVNDLIDRLANCGGSCESDRVERIMKGACASVLGSAAMLVQ